MLVQTARFGPVEVADDKVVLFPDGLIGFPEAKRFVLLAPSESSEPGTAGPGRPEPQGVADSENKPGPQRPEGEPRVRFRWLQCLDRTDLAFLVASPLEFVSEYTVELSRETQEKLKLAEGHEITLAVILTVPEDPRRMTANLAGPLVINVDTRLGCQAVQDNQRCPVRYPVFGQMKGAAATPPGPGSQQAPRGARHPGIRDAGVAAPRRSQASAGMR